MRNSRLQKLQTRILKLETSPKPSSVKSVFISVHPWFKFSEFGIPSDFIISHSDNAVPNSIFRYSHRVTYSECTIGNHVYYSRYLDILEIARGEFFRQLGKTFLQWQEQDVIFPVVECRMRHKAPARYDHLLTIETWLTTIERIRLNFAYRILNEQTLLVEGETFHVCTGLDEKPKKLPHDLEMLLKPYLRPPS